MPESPAERLPKGSVAMEGTSHCVSVTVVCSVKASALPHEHGMVLELLSAVSQLRSACVTSPRASQRDTRAARFQLSVETSCLLS